MNIIKIMENIGEIAQDPDPLSTQNIRRRTSCVYPLSATLKFLNRQDEQEYQKSLTGNFRTATLSGIPLRERLRRFSCAFTSLLSTLAVFHVLSYLFLGLDLLTFTISLVVQASIGLLSGGLIFLAFKKPSARYSVESLQLSYIVMGMTLIVTNYSIVEYCLGHEASGLEYPVILILVVLMSVSKYVLLFNYCWFLIWNSIFLSVHVAFMTSVNPEDFHEDLLEFAMGVIFLLFQTRSFYFDEKHARLNYHSRKRNSKRSQGSLGSVKFIRNRMVTTLLGLVSSIEDVAKISKKLPQHLHKRMCKISESLYDAMNFVGASYHDVELDAITQEIDEEDKAFIMESYAVQNDGTCRKNNRRGTVELMSEEISTEVSEEITGIGKTWNIDFFALFKDKMIKKTGCYLIKKYSLNTIFGISDENSVEFFGSVENNYKAHSYHNSTHAVDVTASFLYFINNSELAVGISDLEILGGIIASLGHDIAHPGLTSRYLITTRSPLAMKYNDTSILEMMHSTLIFKILREESCNILANLPENEWVLLRKIIISLILATDLTKHFELIGRFRAKTINNPARPLATLDDRLDVLQVAIKAADVGHTAKEGSLHQKWSYLVIEEFFHQGDLERSQGMKISMYCDRESTDIAKSQAGFIRHIALPLYEAFNNYLLSSVIQENCIEQLKLNYEFWEYNRFSKHKTELNSTESAKISARQGSLVNRNTVKINQNLLFEY